MSSVADTKVTYVSADQHGVQRVGGTGVMLESIVYSFLQGDSAESIQQQYPALSLEQVYGTIAYYLRNRGEVDAYLRARNQDWQKLKNEMESRSPVLDRLRAMKRGGKKPA